jgi:tetratricopeptide (TPR) repeat protein
MNVSIVYEKKNKKKDAIAALNQAIRYNPKYNKALVRRGDWYLSEKEYDEAIRDYSDAMDVDPNGFNVR